MALPKEISPNPLITSTVEIRFSSSVNEEDVLNVFYPVFSKNFPKIKEKDRIPKELKNKRPEFKYIADYILLNEDYSLSIGANSIAFENVGTYHLWENYFSMIKTNLNILSELNIVKEINRIGVRYASIFENKEDITDVLNVDFELKFDGYTQDVQSLRTDFNKGDIKLHIQIAKNAKFEKNENDVVKTIEGLYVDIDASSEKNMPNKLGDEFYTLIDTLHKEQKTFLFETLMKKEFLQSLNPKY